MSGMSFDFGDVRIHVPDEYLEKLVDLAWFWGHTSLAEKIDSNGTHIVDINREEFIQLTELLYALIR